jgi:hypothetical protein
VTRLLGLPLPAGNVIENPVPDTEPRAVPTLAIPGVKPAGCWVSVIVYLPGRRLRNT